MPNPISQRDSFWNKIYEIARDDRRVVIVSADMGAPALDQFRLNLPGQFINVGIAEQNGILVASGLAREGKRPFFYAIAPFAVMRPIELVRVNNAIMNIPITIVGVGAGFSYEDSGPTHHLLEDIALMRAFPNITSVDMSSTINQVQRVLDQVIRAVEFLFGFALLAGLIVLVGACLSVSTLDAGTSTLGYIARLLPLGLGAGLFQSPNNSAIMGAAPRERLGVASGLLSLSRVFGQVTGLPLIGAVFASRIYAVTTLDRGMDASNAPPWAIVEGVQAAFLAGAALVAIGVVLAVLAFRLDRRRRVAALDAAHMPDAARG